MLYIIYTKTIIYSKYIVAIQLADFLAFWHIYVAAVDDNLFFLIRVYAFKDSC